jgi:type III restriction enzyme
VIEGYELDSGKIYALDNSLDESLLEKEKKAVYSTNAGKRKAINKFYRMDSDGEYDFAQSLENNPNVLLFTKLKKGGFIIDTPYGNYSPDWAIVYKNENDVSKLYFIAETKIDKEWSELDGKEQLKIICGKKHFEAVSSDITFIKTSVIKL